MTDNPRTAAPFEAQFHAGRAQEFVISRMLRQINTATLVRVEAVYPTAGAVGFVDVRPLITQVDTAGKLIEPPLMFRQPYVRVQGGTSALILDPQPGDIGIALFAQRDISAVVATQDQGAAATNRAYDAGDGLYIGGVLNGDPTQYVRFLPDGGIDIHTPGDVNVTCDGSANIRAGAPSELEAPAWTVRGPVEFVDPITAPEATVNGVAVSTHKHQVVAVGQPTLGPQ